MSLLDRGQSLFHAGDKEGALRCFYEALNDDFNDATVLFHIGTLLLDLGHHGAAASMLYRSLQCKAPNPDALLNLGNCYKKENDWAGAEEVWQMAFTMFQQQGRVDDMAGTLSNLGCIYVNNGEAEKSLGYFDKALQIKPGLHDAIANRASAYLWLGRWREGWAGYDDYMLLESRVLRPYIDKKQSSMLPWWDGSPGRKPVVYGEQGIGDEIMYASMIPDVLARCPQAIFDCHPRLEKTWKRSFGMSCYGTRKSAGVGAWMAREKPDCAIPVASLGKFFRNERTEFPGTPYLQPDRETMALFVRQRRGKPRIGISWAGGSKKTGRRLRSIPLAAFIPLLTAIDADWYSLQYTDAAGSEVDRLEMETGIHLLHFPDLVQHDDYDRTICLTASLDLVITCATSILHVAGGLGVPCWVMAPYESAWRESGNDEGRRRAEMPWYNSVRLYHRGKADPDWQPTIERVRQDLLAMFRRQAAE